MEEEEEEEEQSSDKETKYGSCTSILTNRYPKHVTGADISP